MTARTPRVRSRRTLRRTPRHAPRMPFALLVTVVVLAGMALLLGLNTLAAANEVQRHTLATRDQVIAAQVEQLRIDVADSAAPANLASAAAALGMVPAGNPAFIVDVGGRLVVRGKPLPAPYPVVPVARRSTPKKPKPTPTPTSKPTDKTTRTADPKTTTAASPTSAKTTSTTSRGHGRHATTTTPSPTPAPTPTPTPTPTVTLPGGPR